MTLVVFDKLIKKLVEKKTWQRVSLVCFLIFTTLPVIEGNIANAEIFMILPTILGVSLLIDGWSKKIAKWKYVLAGMMFSVAFLFKVPALFEFLGLGFFFIVLANKNLKEMFASLKQVRWWLVLGGFLFPIVLSLAYYWFKGAGQEYLVAAFLQNIGYLSSWRTGSITKSGASTQSGLAIRGLILFLIMAVFFFKAKKLNWKYKLVWTWTWFALFGALLSERPYPHYLLQVVASGSLLIGMSA